MQSRRIRFPRKAPASQILPPKADGFRQKKALSNRQSFSFLGWEIGLEPTTLRATT